jgi:hypothetical protein
MNEYSLAKVQLIIWQIEKLFKQVNVVIIHKVYN